MTRLACGIGVRRWLIACAVAIGVGLCGSTSWAATLYVDAGCGDDSWSGLDPNCVAPDGPKATIQAAINAASDGDTIEVQEGTIMRT